MNVGTISFLSYKYLQSARTILTQIKLLKRMEEIRKQAFQTFGKGIVEGELFDRNLEKLLKVMNKLTAEDVQLDNSLLLPRTRDDAPVTYIEIMEHPRFTINMFVLRPGCRLPLHDHPKMYGICKVVEGKVGIRNFSLCEKKSEGKVVKALVEGERVVGKEDEPILLTPVKGNIHEMKAVDGGAAFVDVLAPPYLSNIDGLGPRPCQYFLEATNSKIGDLVDLLKVDRIPDYYTDFAPYLGQ